MPWINKTPKKPKSTTHKETDMRALRKIAYNNTQWRKVRQTYIQNHPVCEECLKKGIVNAGTMENPLSVHHIRSPFAKGVIDYDLLLDDHNLETVCQQCHADIHNEEHGYQSPEKIIAILDDLLLNDNWDEDDDK